MVANAFDYPQFKGSIPALITPMLENGEIDFEAYKKLIDWHVQEGSDALVVVGTSGESPTVDFEEHGELIRVAVTHANGRIPIIAGVGGNSTKEAIYLTQHAEKAGAQAGLSVVPYYNKPTQEGMYLHFKTIAENTSLPIILYNVPGRTSVNMTNETIIRLAQIPGIMGIKEASGDISRLGELLRDKPDHFQVYSGDDPTAAALILLGGSANISVTANVAPRAMHDLCVAAAQGDLAKVRELNGRLATLNRLLFVEANPIPVKYAVARMGLSQLGYRLPLSHMSEGNRVLVEQALKQAGLIQ
ncbi:dihydrodipicolinate synthase [Pelistega indica]|uniref:4-hydroxy-tetrahydrodipicolinate synthase n=1 Tax=Pelistega indica TaxID=1414851 RepID=V8G940_9BURK|nr:4-hydroxy-tetrahydrodipicolinate synthase [Pelistega indica]ETD72222.1 dihydrodipicolinate synthase [Pelistega indica]